MDCMVPEYDLPQGGQSFPDRRIQHGKHLGRSWMVLCSSFLQPLNAAGDIFRNAVTQHVEFRDAALCARISQIRGG